MPDPERGKSPAGFRKQFLQLLRNEALRTGIPVERLQQRVAFERLLARLPRTGDWILKGGLALQFRYGLLSRSTRDVDLRIAAEPAEGLRQVRAIVAAAANADFFTFEFGETAQELQGAPGGSLRVKVSARVAGVQLTSFHIDLSAGDALMDEPDQLIGSDFLSFANIAPVEFPVYPIAQHLAEKLHAYTLPRAQENTRVKDLVDLVTFAANECIDARRLERCVLGTFQIRATHELPDQLPRPPAVWADSFRTIAREVATVSITELWEGYELAARLWSPFLAQSVRDKFWNPTPGHWMAAEEFDSQDPAN